MQKPMDSCVCCISTSSESIHIRVSKSAKIRNRYNQVPHLTQDTKGKVTNSQLDTTNESQVVSHSPAGDHKAHINRCAQRDSRHKTEQKHKRATISKEVPPWNGHIYFSRDKHVPVEFWYTYFTRNVNLKNERTF